MKTTETTVARFVGCVKQTSRIGGSVHLRGVYEIPNPDGTTALYERHTSQISGMGWCPIDKQPTLLGRVWAWIGHNGSYSAVGTHVQVYDGPETVEVSWRPCHEVAAENAAICLVGRAHVPSNQRGIKDLMEPACTVEEAMAGYTPEKYPGWSLDADTGHGTSTPCPNLSEQVALETERIGREFDELLNKEIVSRAKVVLDGKPTYRLVKETDEETVRVTVGFNSGLAPDYYIPEGWTPSEETRKCLAEMRTEKARLEAKGREIERHFMAGWGILLARYQVALGQLGLKLGEDNHSLRNEFRVGAKNADDVYVECPAGGKDGPHYHTSYAEMADWLDANATTYDVNETARHLAKKIANAKPIPQRKV